MKAAEKVINEKEHGFNHSTIQLTENGDYQLSKINFPCTMPNLSNGKILAENQSNLTGVERQEHIGDLVEKLKSEKKNELNDLITGLLKKMIAENASDLDIGGSGCAEKIWFRIHGIKKPADDIDNINPDDSDILIQSMLSDRQREHLFQHRNLDFSFQINSEEGINRFRADVYFDLDHLALNMRHIPNTIRPFEELHLHEEVADILNFSKNGQGLTLITGITGSGKSSTLDSIIDANNKTADAHIVIIGAPVETIHTPKRCIVRHREIGKDVLTFKDGAVQALRQDPDIIVIGEMRDQETIMAVLEITDSGHKVFSTLHTASAVESIDRIVGETPVNEQERVRVRLADTLICVISQKLVPDLNKTRTLAKEVLVISPSVKAAIRNGNTGEIYQMIFEGKDSGMITLEQDLVSLFHNRKISRETAMQYANNKDRMADLLGYRKR